MAACADVVVQVNIVLARHTSHVTRHTSLSLADYVIRSPYLDGVRKQNVLQVTHDV